MGKSINQSPRTLFQLLPVRCSSHFPGEAWAREAHTLLCLWVMESCWQLSGSAWARKFSWVVLLIKLIVKSWRWGHVRGVEMLMRIVLLQQKIFCGPPRAGPTLRSCSSFPQENAEGASCSKVAQAVMPKASCCGKQPRKNVLSL